MRPCLALILFALLLPSGALAGPAFQADENPVELLWGRLVSLQRLSTGDGDGDGLATTTGETSNTNTSFGAEDEGGEVPPNGDDLDSTTYSGASPPENRSSSFLQYLIGIIFGQDRPWECHKDGRCK